MDIAFAMSKVLALIPIVAKVIILLILCVVIELKLFFNSIYDRKSC